MLTHDSRRFDCFAALFCAALVVLYSAGCNTGTSSGGTGSGNTPANTNTNANVNGNANENTNQNTNTGGSRPGAGRPVDPSGSTVPVCGDGMIDTAAGEQCDDGNTVSGDGCDANCQAENGVGGVAPACGDGNLDDGEECDDRNTVSGDGCDANCKTEDSDGSGTEPVCGDGTLDDGEECDDRNTVSGDGCDANCKTEDGVGGTEPVCGDGTLDDGEECDDRNTVSGDGCDANCKTEDGGGGTGGGGGTDPVCGNGTLEAGEQCDDRNTDSGDGCDADCRIESGSGPVNNSCSTPQSVGDGKISFVSDGATTDSISVVETCSSAAPIEWGADVWFRYEATCTGTATISLCGSRYDNTAAVYSGSGCPSDPALACNDDGCGPGADSPSSRVTFPAVEGDSYMIRIGGYVGTSGADMGTGSLTIFCGNDSGRGPGNCGSGSSDCFTVDPSPTCSDADCCSTICALDPYCCDVEWDGVCVEEGIGICGDGFDVCTGGTGDCFAEDPDQSPGCSESGCCQAVCEQDPFCCVNYWDEFCAQDAAATCSALEVCAGATGSCTGEHTTPGCSISTCCEVICLDDPFCCTTEWDQTCVDLAGSLCR